MTRHPRTPSSKGKARSSSSRTPLQFLRSPTKTLDTKNTIQRKFKDFVKHLADFAGDPCELLCDHHIPRKLQLQYMTGTPDDGRYYRVCDNPDCDYYNKPQYITERLPKKFASMLSKRRKLFDVESTTIEALEDLEGELTAQVDKHDSSDGNYEPATPMAGPSRNNTSSHSRRGTVARNLVWEDSSEEDDGPTATLPSSPCVRTPSSTKKAQVWSPEPEPHWVVCAYTENGKHPLVYKFTFGLGTSPSQIFDTFQLNPTDTVAFFTQRNGAQWTYMHAEDVGFVDALVEDGELFVWVKSGMTDLPDIEKYTGGYEGPVWVPRKGGKGGKGGKGKAKADSKDIIDLTV